MVCHRFCPQALAEALKVNKTITKIVLSNNEIGNEGAKAWWLARGSVAPGLTSSGVPVACAFFAKKSLKWYGNKMQVGRGTVF